ncbi:MBL fold metallo-hydrolase [Aquibacillus rhizosphaerae]|uniref:MBL fold metallo-hydrolase n=1 Tax=Aquibacillus rhizosphaerae TaxID=3051431 RepID=A0ABT7L1Q5_9BACI|nr:MBL fold metallo-hydrolase [Aquibacillus sp. LR5S19]MDL4839775.1 MBL fold metallo-hydrolase [Aquibacillus sp. LR5S19]
MILTNNTIHSIDFLKHFFPVSCYLVEEDESLTLVDAALPYSAKKIIRTARLIGKPITKIVLTHGHEDHVGALDKLKKILPDCTVYISRRDAKLLMGDLSLESGEPELPIRGGAPKGIVTKPNILIKDGDRIGSLLAIGTPGHTPGSMSFIDIRNNSLIAGGAFQTRTGIAVSGQLKVLFPFPALATWNKQESVESARKILEFNPQVLFVGHGKPLENPIPLIKQAILKAEKKLKSTRPRSV